MALRRRNLLAKVTVSGLLIIFSLVSCEPVDAVLTARPQPPTQISFFATDTPPPFIVPITETSSPTLALPRQITDTPSPSASPTKWWKVYFTDPLTKRDPEVIEAQSKRS